MRKEKVVLLWVLQHLLNLLHFVERVIHVFYVLCLFRTHVHSPLFNFFSCGCWSFNISVTCLPFHTGCALNLFAWGFCKMHIQWFMHPWHTLAPRLFHTHQPIASFHFTHLWGQLCATLSSQHNHTHSAKPHSSLSAPASLMFLTVPQYPQSTGLQRPRFLWEQIIVIFLFSPSICSPLWWHTHYLFYDWGLNLNSLSPSVTRHTMASSLSTGVSFLQHIRAP